LSVGEIAARLGFNDASTFYRAFRKWTGSAPGAWRVSALASAAASATAAASASAAALASIAAGHGAAAAAETLRATTLLP